MTYEAFNILVREVQEEIIKYYEQQSKSYIILDNLDKIAKVEGVDRYYED